MDIGLNKEDALDPKNSIALLFLTIITISALNLNFPFTYVYWLIFMVFSIIYFSALSGFAMKNQLEKKSEIKKFSMHVYSTVMIYTLCYIIIGIQILDFMLFANEIPEQYLGLAIQAKTVISATTVIMLFYFLDNIPKHAKLIRITNSDIKHFFRSLIFKINLPKFFVSATMVIFLVGLVLSLVSRYDLISLVPLITAFLLLPWISHRLYNYLSVNTEFN